MNTQSTTKINKVTVVGGGAAGMLAALSASSAGAAVTLVEKNPYMGKKLNITGKGRCNLTNECDARTFLENVPRNPKFLYKAVSAFPPSAIIEYFESLGVPLKTERGRRVFPQSDRARDITDALVKTMKSQCITTVHGDVNGLIINDGICTGVRYSNGSGAHEIISDSVILATGGMSYPITGSDGSGYALARAAGHTVTPLRPSLVPLVSDDLVCAELMGLSLKNVGVSLEYGGKCIYSETGEMLFTHFGVSGPLILSASSYITAFPLLLSIDLKPALDIQTLDNRVLSDFSEEKNKDFANSLSRLLPQKMIRPVVERSKIDPKKQVNSVTKAERRQLVSVLKNFTVNITGTRPIEEAIITSGGVSVKEIDPSTMRSKLVGGLYFAGEIIDTDAYTGGYNLTIAFATGHLAGTSAAT